MSQRVPKESVANVVASAERLRMELLDALRRGEKSQSAGVRIEMVMLYGQAFGAVYEACILQTTRGPLTAMVMQECLQDWRSLACG